ncbi:hypothetical protein K443DRAFT_501914 [Laccaria amethystina LaAM-08-1]|uniref:Uncharacterized protein n=1 Tax=Laccaria amethystina LaAM-08-1 TaxID=1095629 RepID=A0A0C9WUN0_9AGAR|nr:hypothetical protein K443DRAFT_501914 [Laccaria amethystina LaAM-08-1]
MITTCDTSPYIPHSKCMYSHTGSCFQRLLCLFRILKLFQCCTIFGSPLCQILSIF